ncbi:MAG: hypothetical protein WCQ95_03515 [Bacteroidota bacterium]
MHPIDNNSKYTEFRKVYKKFYYESFSYQKGNKDFKITYCFRIDNEFVFNPVITIPYRDFYRFENVSESLLQSLIFHIGMIELISYWKAVCPIQLIIKPYKLSEEQILWWKKLYFFGLAEFFYLNSIQADINNFVQILSESGSIPIKSIFSTDGSCIVPVGGGKDSVVTLELLKKLYEVTPMVINPRRATDACIEVAGYPINKCIIVSRTIDPLLLTLNEKGFLNGHTPFSAMLAFVSLLTAIISGKGMVALSNEASANESTIVGLKINHQYSKSFEFEKDFREYVEKFIVSEINYHSFLRPLQELQIACLFAKQEKYFPVFKSCNSGSKSDIWCCNCSKCLFAFIILSPFITKDKMNEIFGDNLLNKPTMQIYFNQLSGTESIKPFECVGTIEEVNLALCMIIEKYDRPLPYLLKRYVVSKNFQKYKKINPLLIMKSFEKENFLNAEEISLLKTTLSC